MQAYHGQPIGPYISQNPYGQTQSTYYTQYTPYGPYVPLGQGVPFPPGGYGGEPHDARPPPQGPQTRARQRPPHQPHRKSSQSGPAKELKGILKPSREMREGREGTSSVGHGDPSLTRSRTNSLPRPRANSSTHPQFDNFPPFMPEHLFLALDNTSELRIEGIAYQHTIDELREEILPLWPHGVVMEDSRDHRWRAQFAGKPWVSSGTDGIYARRLLSRLFYVLARGGYNYISTVNTSSTPCRLLFGSGEPPDDVPYFFTVCFSHAGDKVSVVDAPPHLVQHLGRTLRGYFRNKVASDTFTEDSVYVVQMKRSLGGSDVDKTILAASVLKFWKDIGFEVNGSLPLGRRLNFGSKKEVWMFKGMLPRPPSAHGNR